MSEKISSFFKKAKTNKKGIGNILKGCWDNLKDLFHQLTPHERAVIITISTLIILFGPALIGYFQLIFMALDENSSFSLATAMQQDFFRYLIVGWTVGLPITLTIFILVGMLLSTFVIMRAPELSQIAEVDENGVAYAKKSTYGTARWLSREEAETVYDIGNINNATGYILGQLERKGDGTKNCISLPTSAGGNQNYMVIGSPGRGKTFSFGFNAVLQAMVREESVVVVDPKGELCEKLFDVCVKHGYNTKVYNLVDPTHSNAWNFTSEIFNPNTGNLDLSRLQSFVNIIMTNTVEGEKEDPFWGSGEKNLFTAATGYLGWKHEITYAENLRRASEDWRNISLIRMSDEDRKRTFDIIEDEKSSIRDIELAMTTIMRASNLLSENEIYDYLREIREDSDPITIDRIFALFVKNDLEALVTMFDQANIPLSHPAAITWSIFKRGDKKIQPNFVQGLTQRLMLFANTDINSMSAHDDINFRDLGQRKTAIFCVISANDSSRKLLSSLFFSFLFRDVSDAANELGPENRIPVNVMCDEFANIGRIPDFDRFISTVRSQKIYLTIIIQSIAQLAKVYDENDQETIMECCDTVVFLGCNGLRTAQFISELSGIASIIVNSVRDQKNVAGMRGITQDFSTSDGAGKRYLVNPDEAMTMDKEQVLIYHAGMNMMKAYRCGYIFHPYMKEMPKKGRKLSTFPTVTEMYGEYVDIFSDLCVQNTLRTTREKVRSLLNAANIELDPDSDDENLAQATSVQPKQAYVPPVLPIMHPRIHQNENAVFSALDTINEPINEKPKEQVPITSSQSSSRTGSSTKACSPKQEKEKSVSVSNKSVQKTLVPSNPYAEEQIMSPRKKKKKKHPDTKITQRAPNHSSLSL